MTPKEVLQRVQKIQERAKEATPEPWVVFVKVISGGYDIKGPPCGPVGQFDKLADALFITSARANIPWLCEQVIQQQATIERLQEARLAVYRGPEVEEAPTPEEIRGIMPNLTGGKPSEQYLKERWRGPT